MNRLIAAIDQRRGIADDTGIPWQGRIPSDSRYFTEQTRTGIVVMGYRTYEELEGPLGEGDNLVVLRPGPAPALKSGFRPITDLQAVLGQSSGNTMWIIGGAALFQQAMTFADELYLTQLEEDFHCTKFFPEFESSFTLSSEKPPISENDIRFCFQTWSRNRT